MGCASSIVEIIGFAILAYLAIRMLESNRLALPLRANRLFINNR